MKCMTGPRSPLGTQFSSFVPRPRSCPAHSCSSKTNRALTYLFFSFVNAGSNCLSKENICVFLKWTLSPIGYVDENRSAFASQPAPFPHKQAQGLNSCDSVSRLLRDNVPPPPPFLIHLVKRGSCVRRNPIQNNEGPDTVVFPSFLKAGVWAGRSGVHPHVGLETSYPYASAQIWRIIFHSRQGCPDVSS